YDTTAGAASSTNHDDFLLKFIPIPLAANIAGTDDSCGCTGTATVSACGTPPFQYLWNNGQTMQTISGLCAGNYSVIIYDNACSSDTAYVTISSLSLLTASLSSI